MLMVSKPMLLSSMPLKTTYDYGEAMDKFISDGAQVELSDRTKDAVRALCIDDWHSEAHYQHQNFAEHCWHHIKKNVEWLMNLRNCPPEVWLLALQYVCDIMNHTAKKSLGN